MPPKIAEAVDRWAGKQDDKPRRSEAIRRLVEIGLQKEARFKPFPKDHSIGWRAPPARAEGEEVMPVVGKPPWTLEEDERLRALAMSRISVAAMAEQLKRSEAAVRNRAYRLKLVVTKSRLLKRQESDQPVELGLKVRK